MVEVTEPPAVAVATPSVLVLDRPVLAPSVSLSGGEWLPGVGSVSPPPALTMAVLLREPGTAAAMVQVAVSGTLPPAGRLTVSPMMPEPEAVQVPPPAPTQVQVQVSDAGKVSVTVAPVASLGPELVGAEV